MMLLHKLDEEVNELLESECSSPEEYADVLTVLGALANYKSVPEEVIKEVAETKILEKGGFRKGIVWVKE